VAASQLGSILVLFIALVSLAAKTIFYRNDRGDGATLVQFWLVFVATGLFYYLEECMIEEESFHRLRNLRWPRIGPEQGALSLQSLEYVVRVAAFVVLGVVGALIYRLNDYGLSGIDAGFIGLALVYILFLLWDVLVAVGGEVEMIWRLFWCDLIGTLLTLFLVLFHQYGLISGIATSGLIVIIVLQVHSANLGPFLGRFLRRETLR